MRQRDPALALDPVERLISTAPGRSPEPVITVLWWLNGEALIALGDVVEAHSLP